MATINGTPGNDALTGTLGKDTINGYGGDDKIDGLAGNDVLYGGGGNDLLKGWQGDDLIHGGGGRDNIFAGSGADTVSGGTGDDKLHGEAGDDVLTGNAGNDIFFGGFGNDTFEGGAGFDYVSYIDETAGVVVGLGDDVLGGSSSTFFQGEQEADYFKGIEGAYGSAFDDHLATIQESGTLYGLGGNDTIYGSYFDDRLYGGDGNDIIIGARGNDFLSGGAGDDRINTFITETNNGDHTIETGSGNDIVGFFLIPDQVAGNQFVTDFNVAKDQLRIEGNTSGTEYISDYAVATYLDSNEDGVVDAKDDVVDKVQVGDRSALKLDVGVTFGYAAGEHTITLLGVNKLTYESLSYADIG